MFFTRRRHLCSKLSASRSNHRNRRVNKLETLEARQLLAAEIAGPLTEVALPVHSLHNSVMPADVDQSGHVSALDALIVINRLNQQDVSGESELEETSVDGKTLLYDTSNDGSVTARDALIVINTMNSAPLAASASATNGDLQVNGARIVDGNFDDLPSPMPGEEFGVIVDYQTDGLSSDASYDVSVFLDGIPMKNQHSFGAGGGLQFFFTTPRGHFARPGTHELEVVLDAEGNITESDESNNRLTFQFTTAETTDLPEKFVWPLGGEANIDWAVFNYLDVDPRPGVRADFRGGPYQYDSHQGYDLNNPHFAAMDRGVPVFTAASGTVTEVRDDVFDRGDNANRDANFVTVDHGDGWQTRYFHLAEDSVTVKVGDSVTRGQTIAMSASSDTGTGHLHWDIKRHGRKIEPMMAPELYFLDVPTYQADQQPIISDLLITNENAFTSPDVRERPSEVAEFSTSESDTIYLNYFYTHRNDGDPVDIRWIAPDASVVQTNGYVTNGDGRQSADQWVLPPSVWQTQTGTWTVEVNIDGDIKTTTFDVVTGDAAPEIRVREGGVAALDGRTTTYDFGEVANNATAPTKTFTITNHGGGNLTVANPQLPDGFSLVGSFPLSIAADASANFTVRLDTNVVGRKLGEIRFDTNDASEPDYDFMLEGVVTGTPEAGTPTLTSNRPNANDFQPGDPANRLFAATTLGDTATSLDGAVLRIVQVAGGADGDGISLLHQGNGSGEVGHAGNDVSFGGAVIASLSVVDSTSLEVTFNAAATTTAVEAVISRLGWQTSDGDWTAPRTVALEFTNADSKTSEKIYREVLISERRLILDVPAINNSQRSLVETIDAPLTITRTGDVSGPLSVTLQSSDSSEATVPTTVEFLAGQRTLTTAMVSAVSDGTLDGLQPVTLSASASGYAGSSFAMSVEDQPSLSVTNTNDSGAGSLRQAIIDANAATGPSTIAFAIPSTDPGFIDIDSAIAGGDLDPDVFRIELLSGLPSLFNAAGLTISGSSQHGQTGDSNPLGPEIVLAGSQAGEHSHGLRIFSDDVTIEGLVIQDFELDGIETQAANTTIVGNHIGVDASGTMAAANGQYGIAVRVATNATIGGTTPSDRNVISGNISDGIQVFRSSGTRILGNSIGTSADGAMEIGNRVGISLNLTGTSGTIVDSNTVSGNVLEAIAVTGDSTDRAVISSNQIGLSADRTQVVPNGGVGLRISDAYNVDVSDNVIAGNDSSGVVLSSSRDIALQRNQIGAVQTGQTDWGNDGQGLFIIRSLDIDVIDNTISGNSFTGLHIADSLVEPQLVQWTVADGGNDHWYWLTPDQRTWDFHRDQAVALGGDLAAVASGDENQFIVDALLTPSGVNAAWHGFNDAAIEGTFVWSNGEPDTYTNWGINEPNGGTRENFAHFSPGGLWNDVDRFNRNFAIVEFDAEPSRQSLIDVYRQITVQGNHIGVSADGSTALSNSVGVNVSRSGNIVIGGNDDQDKNVISGNGSGLFLDAASNLTIVGNHIGVDAEGTTSIANGAAGLFGVNVRDITISDNVVSGNVQDGISILDGRSVTISQNTVGLNASGMAELSNGGTGISILDSHDVDVSDNFVGGNDGRGVLFERSGLLGDFFQWTIADGGNDQWYWLTTHRGSWQEHDLIAEQLGVDLVTVDSQEENEFIETTILPTARNGSAWHGLNDIKTEGDFQWSSGAEVGYLNWRSDQPDGGTFAQFGHFFSDGTWGDAQRFDYFPSIIEFPSAPDQSAIASLLGELTLHSNEIGVAADGTSPAGNAGLGLHVIGSENLAVTDNVIANATFSGIATDNSADLLFTGNRIGVTVDGTAAANSNHGIELLNTTRVTIGGSAAGEGNTIAHNGGSGILAAGQSSDITVVSNDINANAGAGVFVNNFETQTVTVSTNSISNNAGLGIDLAPTGPTANDLQDLDLGANGLQNHPIVTSVTEIDLNDIITGTLNSTPNSIFDIEFFASTPSMASEAEGSQFLGSATASTNADGDASFGLILTGRVPAGTFVTSTATDAAGNTSEFSPAFLVAGSLTLSIDPASIAEDGSATATVTRSGLTDRELTVTITPDDNTEVTAPTTVVISVGSDSATFVVSGVDDAQVDGDQLVNVAVAATGFASDSVSLDVTDIGVIADTFAPVANVNALPTIATAKSFTVSVTAQDLVDPNEPASTPSGVAEIDIYVAQDGGAFALWTTVPASDPEAVFDAVEGHSYSFHALARDEAGNVEVVPNAGVRIEAGTFVPDLTAPTTAVVALDDSGDLLAINVSATDTGSSGLRSLRVTASIDGGASTEIGTATAPASTNSITANFNMPMIADSADHTYVISVFAVDAAGNETQLADAATQTIVINRDPPATLDILAMDIAGGMTQRSFIRELDIVFNDTQGLSEIAAGGLSLVGLGVDGNATEQSVDLTGRVGINGSQLNIDFGDEGIGGDADRDTGNGIYELRVDLDNDGVVDEVFRFFRLLGDANGDGVVDQDDTASVNNAYATNRQDLENDIDGNGRVDGRDRRAVQRQIGQAITGPL